MTEYRLQQNGFTISTNPALLDFDMIYEFIVHESYWGEGMTRGRLQQQIEATTFNFGVYKGQQQVGFAQVLTNFVSFAYLGNVFIVEAYRGQGLSKWLMQAISDHPALQKIRRWLYAHPRRARPVQPIRISGIEQARGVHGTISQRITDPLSRRNYLRIILASAVLLTLLGSIPRLAPQAREEVIISKARVVELKA